MFGWAGVSVIIALFADFIAISTIHLHIFYLVARRIYSWQVNGIISLFTLFRGKKRNVLRNRVDSAEYNLDQLLLGTLMFSVLVFLFPTVALFYLLFSMSRVVVISVHIFLEGKAYDTSIFF